MNITLSTYGSEGDVQPYVEFAKGLVGAGHQVTRAVNIIQGILRRNNH